MRRVWVQMLYATAFALLVAPSSRRPDVMLTAVLALLIVWIAGGVLAFLRRRAADSLLLAGSMAPLLLGLVFQYHRLAFVARHRALQLADGTGSPSAFLAAWALETLLFLVPGVAFVGWNFAVIRREDRAAINP